MGAVQAFDDDEEAVALANDTTYGLAAGVWTRELDRAWRVGRALDAGTVWINTYNRFYAEASASGCKQSGIGNALGIAGAEEFTRTKLVNFDGGPTLW